MDARLRLETGHMTTLTRDAIFSCRLEQPIPSVVQEMGRKIHVRAFLFHDVELRNHCVRRRGGCLASSLLSRATCGIVAHGQRLRPRPDDRVIARGQCH